MIFFKYVEIGHLWDNTSHAHREKVHFVPKAIRRWRKLLINLDRFLQIKYIQRYMEETSVTPNLNSAILFLIFSVSAGTATAKMENTKPWRSQMRDLGNALSTVAPDLFNGSNTTNKAEFTKNTKKLFLVSQQLDKTASHGKTIAGSDPSLPYLTHLLREDLELAFHSAESGQIDYAKRVLRSSVSSCVACHTRTSQGPKLPFMQSFAEQIKGASWIDRLAFETANREFDTVTQQVSDTLKGQSKDRVEGLQLEKGARMALAISVRVKENPTEALSLTQNILSSPVATADLKSSASLWKKDLSAWKSEKTVVYNSDAELLAAAEKIMGDVKITQQSTWLPGSEVRFLRASLLMHELLQKYPNSLLIGEALYRIGLSYDVLQDLGNWSLHEMYYQACITKAPHTDLARRCYDRYKESVILGYSGSAGIHLPDAVQLHLSRLEQLANTVKPRAGVR
jgi:cytochrome c553